MLARARIEERLRVEMRMYRRLAVLALLCALPAVAEKPVGAARIEGAVKGQPSESSRFFALPQKEPSNITHVLSAKRRTSRHLVECAELPEEVRALVEAIEAAIGEARQPGSAR